MADNPFALEKFLAFVESKPAEEEYDYLDCDACAIGQYIRTLGGHAEEVGDDGMFFVLDGEHYCAIGLDDGPIASLNELVNDPHPGAETFGALAERVRAALKAREASRG